MGLRGASSPHLEEEGWAVKKMPVLSMSSFECLHPAFLTPQQLWVTVQHSDLRNPDRGSCCGWGTILMHPDISVRSSFTHIPIPYPQVLYVGAQVALSAGHGIRGKVSY